MSLLDQLNKKQREAVTTTDGPLLVLAGAGTGKTRVITYRAAYLIEKGVPPEKILCVTFTNKAAEQMKQRINALLMSIGRTAYNMTVSTFHSFGARLLRREAPRLGLPRDFAIYDDDDQTGAVKMALQQLGLAEREYPPRTMRDRISSAKNHGTGPTEMIAEAFDTFTKTTATVFERYETILKRAGALDFDDLLLRSLELLRDHPEARKKWSERYQYIQVDEFQDTNATQEEFIRLLAGPEKNICVVGDEDQSIYSWRGARAGNLKRFTEEFPNVKVVKLEENYRSTQTILDAAAGVVANNRARLGKTLKATKGAGANVRFFESQDAAGEAEFVTGEIASLLRMEKDKHIAVLYRTTAQSRVMEECLRRMSVRYRVVGGFSFYERAEVRDALAYVRLLFHPEDDIALLRVLNKPARGVGKTTEETLRRIAREQGASLWEILDQAAQPGVTRSGAALRAFRYTIEKLQEEAAELPPAEMLRMVLDKTGYAQWVDQQDRVDHTSRAENLAELLNAMADATQAGQTLQDVLDQAALVSAADGYDDEVNLTLMTLHSAKGLEFDRVYLTGLEEGLLPHSRSVGSEEDVEEERRLCYVGMTRAKEALTMSRAMYRRSYGEERLRASQPSRFLAEIPGELIETVLGSTGEPGEGRRYESDSEYSQYRSRSGMGSGSRSGSRGGFVKPRSAAASTVRSTRPGAHPLVGKRVRHEKFGVGTILMVEDEDDDRVLTVSFSDYGTKKLKERYANLQLA
jgi:DNA helicase-2/ATP-dependent DNA helicase PcrA